MRLTMFEKFIDKLRKEKGLSSENIVELENKIERAENFFSSIQTWIKIHDDCDESKFAIREEFENKFDQVTSKAKVLVSHYREKEIAKLDSDNESVSDKSNKISGVNSNHSGSKSFVNIETTSSRQA